MSNNARVRRTDRNICKKCGRPGWTLLTYALISQNASWSASHVWCTKQSSALSQTEPLQLLECRVLLERQKESIGLVGVLGIEFASLLSKSNKENGVAPLPSFQLEPFGGAIWSHVSACWRGGYRRSTILGPSSSPVNSSEARIVARKAY